LKKAPACRHFHPEPNLSSVALSLPAVSMSNPAKGAKEETLNPEPLFPMPGVGKLLKQAQKMQRQMEALQAQLETKEIAVTAGGGAVAIKVSGSGKFLALKLDPEFLKDDPKLVEETLLLAMQDAAKQAKEHYDAEMQKVTSAFQLPVF
jgi:DNA-binding YbaB/EbfC family protein